MRIASVLLAASLAAWPALAQPAPPLCRGEVRWHGPAPHAPITPTQLPGTAWSRGPVEAPAFEAVLNRAIERMGSVSMAAAVSTEGGVWSGRLGEAPQPLYWWASAGKAATATAILQLVEEGRVSLDDPVSRWVEGVPLGDRITVRMLLDHTSGLFSFNEAASMRSDPRRLTLAEKLALAAAEGSLFCPGQAWRYSNTNYALLGAIVEAVDGKPLHQALTVRIADRLGLKDFRFLDPEGSLEDMVPIPAPVAEQGETFVDPRWVGGAGPVLASPEAMVAFLDGLLTGRLVKRETVLLMLARPWPMFDPIQNYGLGLMVYEVPGPEGAGVTPWIGHSGGAAGIKAVVAWSPRDRAYAAVALTGPGSAEAVANALLMTAGGRR